MPDLRRRQFITLLGGAAVNWPLAARAQQAALPVVGFLNALGENDRPNLPAAFRRGLSETGYVEGRNVAIAYRFAENHHDRLPALAMELIALGPDVILASATPSARAVQQATRTVPIVFVLIPDPVGIGVAASLSRPGGNATGFITHEFGMSVKWLELLKQIAPKVTRAAVFRDPANPAAMGQFGAIQGATPSLGVEILPIGADNAQEIERGISAVAREPNSGLIVVPIPTTTMHHDLIVKLANSYRIPAVYPSRMYVADGGLVSYGWDIVDQYRSAASYVDRILRGKEPADLPVQAPVKYDLIINLKAAKALGLDVPPTLLARADEVIE
jgi:putative tryptophan/tyrosine transport system substrate-binding protein